MGQVTIFGKDNCTYCNKVHDILQKFRETVLLELAEKETELGVKPEIVIKTVDCAKEGAYAAFCIRTTGTFTVPHVFFNEEYIGGATNFLNLDTTCKGGYNVLKNKLIDLALRPCPNPSFPPAPDASMIKVTDTLAFSSQPTTAQLGALSTFGLKSVLNILRPDSAVYYVDEKVIVPTSGVTYLEFPLYVVTSPNIRKALSALESLPTPVLVHDDIGQRSGLLVLMAAAMQMIKSRADVSIRADTVLQWGTDLGLELKPFKAAIAETLAQIQNEQNAPVAASVVVGSPNESLAEQQAS